MGLVDKLTELDQAIWKQYEKVTQYCNKEYGWDKYDLARKSNKGAAVSGVGSATYFALEGVLGSSASHIGVGIFGLAVTGGIYYLFEKSFQLFEKIELKQLDGNSVPAPHFFAWRPMVFSLLTLNHAVKSVQSFLGYHDVPESLKLSQEKYNLLDGLLNASMVCTYVFLASVFYFSTQIMTPPKKKKSVLKTLYEKAIGKIKTAPVPQLEPKYQSIDDVVA